MRNERQPWLRLWCDFLDDPKVQMLSEINQRRFLMLLILKRKGELMKMNDNEQAFAIRVTVESHLESKQHFIDQKLLAQDGDILNWKKRQPRDVTATSRKRKQRRNANPPGELKASTRYVTLCHDPVTLCHDPVTLCHEMSRCPSRPDADADAEEEKKRSTTRKPRVNPSGDHQILIDNFHQRYMKLHDGSKPTWNGKTTALIKRLLKNHGLEECLTRLMLFEGAYTEQAFGADAFTVASFSAGFDRWVPKAKKTQIKPPSSY